MSNFQININNFSNGQIDTTNPQDPKWEGTGIFDVIIKAANENIKIQHKTSRITGAEYAEVYLGTMQSAISEAMKFLLAKEITEKEISLKDSQIIGSGFDNQVKAQQVAESTYRVANILPKELEQITAQIVGYGYDNQVKAQQVLESTYKVEELLPAELLQLQKQVDVIERGMVEQELTGAKQREVLVVDKGIKSYQLSDILPKEAILLTEQKETADAQQLVLAKDLEIKEVQKQVAYVERVIKDKEAAVLGLDNVVKLREASRANGTYVYVPAYEE